MTAAIMASVNAPLAMIPEAKKARGISWGNLLAMEMPTSRAHSIAVRNTARGRIIAELLRFSTHPEPSKNRYSAIIIVAV